MRELSGILGILEDIIPLLQYSGNINLTSPGAVFCFLDLCWFWRVVEWQIGTGIVATNVQQ